MLHKHGEETVSACICGAGSERFLLPAYAGIAPHATQQQAEQHCPAQTRALQRGLSSQQQLRQAAAADAAACCGQPPAPFQLFEALPSNWRKSAATVAKNASSQPRGTLSIKACKAGRLAPVRRSTACLLGLANAELAASAWLLDDSASALADCTVVCRPLSKPCLASSSVASLVACDSVELDRLCSSARSALTVRLSASRLICICRKRTVTS
ncbi:hypothetical protein ABBQ38_004560 [Trebouxia sp. C0009 RCD-2024]